MSQKEKILVQLQKLQPQILETYHAELLGLFGSMSKGKSHKKSDVDILVAYKKGATLFDEARLTLFLEAELQRPVDLVTKDTLKKQLKNTILKTIIPIHE